MTFKTSTAETVAAVGKVPSSAKRKWLDRFDAKDGPLAAFRCFAEVLEYHVPKLARTELTGARGGPIQAEAVQPEPDFSRLDIDELESLSKLLAKAAG